MPPAFNLSQDQTLHLLKLEADPVITFYCLDRSPMFFGSPNNTSTHTNHLKFLKSSTQPFRLSVSALSLAYQGGRILLASLTLSTPFLFSAAETFVSISREAHPTPFSIRVNYYFNTRFWWLFSPHLNHLSGSGRRTIQAKILPSSLLYDICHIYFCHAPFSNLDDMGTARQYLPFIGNDGSIQTHGTSLDMPDCFGC